MTSRLTHRLPEDTRFKHTGQVDSLQINFFYDDVFYGVPEVLRGFVDKRTSVKFSQAVQKMEKNVCVYFDSIIDHPEDQTKKILVLRTRNILSFCKAYIYIPIIISQEEARSIKLVKAGSSPSFVVETVDNYIGTLNKLGNNLLFCAVDLSSRPNKNFEDWAVMAHEGEKRGIIVGVPFAVGVALRGGYPMVINKNLLVQDYVFLTDPEKFYQNEPRS